MVMDAPCWFAGVIVLGIGVIVCICALIVCSLLHMDSGMSCNWPSIVEVNDHTSSVQIHPITAFTDTSQCRVGGSGQRWL